MDIDIETLFRNAVEQAVEKVFTQRLPDILSSYLPQTVEAPVDARAMSAYLDVSPQTLRKYREQGKIPFIKVGKSHRYVKSSVVEALTKKGLI
jgi:hypothetical protein